MLNQFSTESIRVSRCISKTNNCRYLTFSPPIKIFYTLILSKYSEYFWPIFEHLIFIILSSFVSKRMLSQSKSSYYSFFY